MPHDMINYQVRLAKNVERKIICVILKKLFSHYPDFKYVYIGFGSYFFTDFILFQKNLGINEMVSIEGDSDVYKRASYNKPFERIDLINEESTKALRQLQNSYSNVNKFVWLDYINKFRIYKNDNIVLNDLDILLDYVKHGDIYLTTINNYSLFKLGDSNKKINKFFSNYREYWGNSFGNTEDEIINALRKSIDGTQEIFIRHIIKKHIDESLVKNGRKLEFKQIAFIKYQDGAPMLTYGGFFCDKSKVSDFDSWNFDGCSFIRSGGDIYDLQLPVLTYREILALNKVMLEEGTGKEISEKNGNQYLSEYINTYKELGGMYPYFAEII